MAEWRQAAKARKGGEWRRQNNRRRRQAGEENSGRAAAHRAKSENGAGACPLTSLRWAAWAARHGVTMSVGCGARMIMARHEGGDGVGYAVGGAGEE